MKSFLWRIYLYRFLDSFILIGTIFTLFFQNLGLDPYKIALLISIWSVTTLILEVPSGMLADKFSRRNLLILGLVLQTVGFVFWLFGGFFNFAIGFILWGTKNALASGTLEAFVYDELKSYESQQLYEQVSGKMSGYFSLGLMLSTILGGYIANTNYTLVLISSIAITATTIPLLFTMKSVKAVQSTGEVKYLGVLKKAVQQIKHNRSLLYLLIFISIVFSVYAATDEFWPLIYSSFDLNTTTIGILVAMGFGMFSLAGYTVKFFNGDKFKNIDYLLVIASGVIFLSATVFKSILSLPLIFLAIYLIKVANIKFEAKLQHEIASEQRATISSIKSLVFEFVYLGFVLVFGMMATKLGVTSILSIAGGLIFVCGTLPLFTLAKQDKNS